MAFKKNSARLLTCAAILGGGIALAAALSMIKKVPREKPPEELVRTVVVAKVGGEAQRSKIYGHGTARPVKSVTIGAEIKGRVSFLPSENKAGRLVAAGETLAKIDDSDYQLALKEAAAELARLKAEDAVARQFIKDTEEEFANLKRELALEESDFARSKSLFEKGVKNLADFERAEQDLLQRKRQMISIRGALDKAKIQLDVLAAQIEKAAAAKSKAELDLKRCEVASPFAGRIEETYVDQGEFVAVGQKLFDVADDSDLEIPVSLDALEAAKVFDLKPGAKGASANWFEMPKDIDAVIEWVESPADCHWAGRLERLERFDPQTRTLIAVAKPLKGEGQAASSRPLVSGMFCKVAFLGREIPGSLAIPWPAIQHDNDVFVVGPDGRMSSRRVEIIGSDGGNAIIGSGLSPGELVVAQQAPRGAADGMKVKAAIKDPAK